MFLTFLGSALVVGTGLLAAASYSEGALIALRTAAQAIGWLLLLAGAVGASLPGRASLAKAGAATIAFVSGTAMLYLAHFQWDERPSSAIRHAAAAAADWQADPKFVESPPLAAVLVSASAVKPQIIAAPPAEGPRAAPPPQPVKQAVAALAASPPVRDACASLGALESLQCRRCGDKTGLALIFCNENARLEYCDGRPQDEVACPSTTAYSPPG